MKNLLFYLIAAIALMLAASCENKQSENKMSYTASVTSTDPRDIAIDSVLMNSPYDTYELGEEIIIEDTTTFTIERKCPVKFTSPDGEVLDTVFVFYE